MTDFWQGLRPQQQAALMVLIILFLCLAAAGLRRRSPSRTPASATPAHQVDPVILPLGEGDQICLSGSYPGYLISGEISSGKTTSSYAWLIYHLVRAGVHGTFLCAKPNHYAFIEKIYRQAGAADRLVRFAPDGACQIDLLDWLLAQPYSNPQDAATLLCKLVHAAPGQQEHRGGEEFWEHFQTRLILNTLTPIKLATGHCALSDCYRFLRDVPQTPQQVEDVRFTSASFACQCINACQLLKDQRHVVELFTHFWKQEIPHLAPNTLSCGLMSVQNVFAQFIQGPIAVALSSGVTNISPEVLEQKSVVFDFPTLRFGAPAVLGGVIWKALVHKWIMSRKMGPATIPVFVAQDEAVEWVTEEDIRTQQLVREARGINILTVQNLDLLFARLGGGPKGEQLGRALVANLGTKLIHATSSPQDQEFYSNLFGKKSRLLFNANTSHEPPVLWDDQWQQGPQTSGGCSESQPLPIVPPEAFTQLRRGGQEHDFLVDFYCFVNGTRFGNRRPWKKATLPQLLL